MLMRTLISEGRIVHLTSIEDPDSPTGRRVERIIRSGPISLVTTTTTDLYSENETRMLALRIHEDATQTAAVLSGIANTFAGADEAVTSTDLDVWHDLQRWIALGPTDVVIPFAPQIAAKTSSQMVRFRRDLRALFTFIQTSALLHQAQRQVDAKGRVIATLDDYRLAYPIFKAVMSGSSGADVPPNVKSVVRLITERAGTTKAAEPTTTMRFTREVEPARHTREVTISRDQIGTAIGTDKWVAGRAALKAIDLGFLANAEIRLGKPYRLTVKRGTSTKRLSRRSQTRKQSIGRAMLNESFVGTWRPDRSKSRASREQTRVLRLNC